MGSIVEKHLLRLAMPKTWKIKRKGIKYVSRPKSGPHSFKLGLPINLLLRDILNYARTTKEVKNILYNQDILVDGIRRKNHRFIVGLMDVISIPKTKENFRIILNKKGNIAALPIKEEEAKLKPCKIIGKTLLKKGKMQLNMEDGKNIPTKEDKYNVGDSILIEIPSQKIKEVFKLEKGSTVYLTGGKHIGETGLIEGIKENRLVYKREQETFETSKNYAFVIGKEKPSIELTK